MKRTHLLFTVFSILMLTGGAIVQAAEPQSARFGFQVRKVDPKEHFFTVKVNMVGSMPEPIGVNVYWKTKEKNDLQGRAWSSMQPNLPRPGRDFIGNMPETSDAYDEVGNHENIEGLVWDALDMDYRFDNGCAPTTANRFTRFYHHRFDNYALDPQRMGGTCHPAARVKTEGNEDKDAALFSFAFVPIDPSLSSPNKVCNNLGIYCTNNGPGTQYVFIPSANLDYLVIEIFGFYYSSQGQQARQYFYMQPVEAIKYAPANNSSDPGNLKFHAAGDPDPASSVYMRSQGFAGFGLDSQRLGYFNQKGSSYHADEVITNQMGDTKLPNINFMKMDTLNIDLSFTNSGKILEYTNPEGSGLKVKVSSTYMYDACAGSNPNRATECQYPHR